MLLGDIYLSAEPIRVIQQNLFLYSGLDFCFAAAILQARKSLKLLNYKINKINFLFGFILNILCNDKLPVNDNYSNILILNSQEKH